MTYRYHARVLDELARHGLRPLPTTAPGALRDAVRDLYKYEIRVLRERHLAGQIPKRDYASHVVALRRRYAGAVVAMDLAARDPRAAVRARERLHLVLARAVGGVHEPQPGRLGGRPDDRPAVGEPSGVRPLGAVLGLPGVPDRDVREPRESQIVVKA